MPVIIEFSRHIGTYISAKFVSNSTENIKYKGIDEMKLKYKGLLVIFILFVIIVRCTWGKIIVEEENVNQGLVTTVDNGYDKEEKIKESDIDSKESNTFESSNGEQKIARDSGGVGINPERTYEDHFVFPYDKISFTEDSIFDLIKASYKKMNFYGEFENGDTETYDYYKEKFYLLLNGNVSFTYNNNAEFTYPITKGELYINDYYQLGKHMTEELESFQYYFFDMDEDGSPELCIVNPMNSAVPIFKYVKKLDKFILWYEIPPSYKRLSGSRKIRENEDGLNYFLCNYDENGRIESRLFFFSMSDYNKEEADWNNIYMAGLPVYTNGKEQLIISDEIKMKGYFSEAQQMYFYRLKKEQCDQLVRSFGKAENQAIAQLDEVTYTYEELFGEY